MPSVTSTPVTITAFAQDSVAELYLGFFGRLPDVGGWSYWATQISNGTSPLAIAQAFSQTQEFVAQYGNLSAGEQVNLLYEHILNRAPDPGGAQYWTTQLQTGTPIGQIVWTLVNAVFNQQGTVDGALVQGKVHSAEALVAPILTNTPNVAWNVKTGFGEINVASAISAAVVAPLAQGTEVTTGFGAWHISAAHFQDAWAAGYTGKGVVIAEIDTGLDLSNAALTKNISNLSWNFVSQNANVQDDNGHGTAVATLLVANPDNGGLVGGAYDAQLMVLKALDAKGNATDANIVNAINYAVANGANVINLSLGGVAQSPTQLVALNYAASMGVIVCMAAGNNSAATAQYPANYAQQVSTSIAVGSTALNTDGTVAFYGNSNAAGSTMPYNYVDAPGAHILAYGLHGVIQSFSGTSYATPLVTAAVADVLSAHAGISATQVVQAIVNSTIGLVGVQAVVA